VILITHDRSLMEMAADRLWLTADGSIRPFEGDMDDYAKFVLDRARAAARTSEPDPPHAPPPSPPTPVRAGKTPSGPARRRAEAAEATLLRIARALEEIDAALLDPKTFEDSAKAADLARKRQAAQTAMVDAERAWLEAAEALEAIQAGNG